MRALFLSLLAGLSVQVLAGPQDLQWPSGEGVCSGPVYYRLYKSCDQVTIARSAIDSLGGCGIQSQEDVADASCGTAAQDVKCEKPTGQFQAPVPKEHKLFPCDGDCNDDYCRSAVEKVRTNPNQKIDFVSGRPGEKSKVDEHIGGRTGRKTQICTYNVSEAVMEQSTCKVQVAEKCKVQVKFTGQGCRVSQCGLEAEMSRTSYGQSIPNLIKDLGKSVEPASIACSSCDGRPELAAGAELSDAWVAAKAKCLITQYKAFDKVAGEAAKGAKAKIADSMKALRDSAGAKLNDDSNRQMLNILEPAPQ